MSFAKGFKEKVKQPKRPDPGARPAFLYPMVPDDIGDWPEKSGTALLGMPQVKVPTAMKPINGLTPPKQPPMKPAPLGAPKPSALPGLPKLGALSKRPPKKNLFSNFKDPKVDPSGPTNRTPQMATEPLGASMPNQGTGGGIASPN